MGDVDLFVVFCPDTEHIYAVPIEDAKRGGVQYLRVDAPRNSQVKGICWAADYALPA